MSRTIGSPGLDHPVARLVMRRRRVRARGRRSRTRRPRGPRRRGARGPRGSTSASVRPTSRPAAIWSTTRSAAWAAGRSSSISSASLTIRSVAGHLGREPEGPSRERRWSARRCSAHRPRVDEQAARSRRPPARRSAPATSAYGIVGLVPGHDLDQARRGRGHRGAPSPPAAAPRASAIGRSPGGRAWSAAPVGWPRSRSGSAGPRRPEQEGRPAPASSRARQRRLPARETGAAYAAGRSARRVGAGVARSDGRIRTLALEPRAQRSRGPSSNSAR